METWNTDVLGAWTELNSGLFIFISITERSKAALALLNKPQELTYDWEVRDSIESERMFFPSGDKILFRQPNRVLAVGQIIAPTGEALERAQVRSLTVARALERELACKI